MFSDLRFLAISMCFKKKSLLKKFQKKRKLFTLLSFKKIQKTTSITDVVFCG